MGDAVREHGIDKVELVPNVEDPTIPPAQVDATPPRYLVAVVGAPVVGYTLSWNEDDPLGIGFMGYCTWAASGAGAMVPTFIADGETFTVPANKQALFAMDIDNEGTLEVDGFLIQVD